MTVPGDLRMNEVFSCVCTSRREERHFSFAVNFEGPPGKRYS